MQQSYLYNGKPISPATGGEIVFPSTKISVSELLELAKGEFKDQTIVYDVTAVVDPARYKFEFKTIVDDLGSRLKFKINGNLEFFKEIGAKAFLSNFNGGFAATATSVAMLSDIGVSDIYIGGELGFQANNILNLKSRFEHINFRLMPNLCSNDGFIEKPLDDKNLTSFWVRPEDLHLYEDIFDTVELFSVAETSATLEEIYYIDKTWIGDLGVLISRLEQPLMGETVANEFGNARLNCGRKCMYDKCHSCYKILQIGKIFTEARSALVLEDY